MTGFSALNTAIQGLTAAQRGMDVTGQNVVNANTPGYSRQQVLLGAIGPTPTAIMHSGGQQFYGGVEVTSVNRVRDAFVEATNNAANSRMSALTAQSTTLSSTESLMAEPSDTGLATVLDNFYASWHDLGANPDDEGAAATVLAQGQSVADRLKFVADGVDAQWSSAHQTLTDVVTQTNAAASSLAAINEQIRQGTLIGEPVNELLDQRDTLVRQLGTLVGATAVPGVDGQVSVSVNGVQLVSGRTAETFTLTGGGDIPSSAGNPPTITWKGAAVPVDSGQAAGLLSVLGTDLPNVSAKLDSVATALRDSVNSLHSAGFTLSGAAGGDFFTGTGARDLSVVPTSYDQLAVSDTAGTVDGSVAQSIGDLSDETKAAAVLGGTAGASAQWRILSTSVGVQVQSLQNATTVQQSVVQTAQAASDSDSGVNLDEEMTAMLLWQRSYQASARVITTVDSMYDTLINHTGVV